MAVKFDGGENYFAHKKPRTTLQNSSRANFPNSLKLYMKLVNDKQLTEWPLNHLLHISPGTIYTSYQKRFIHANVTDWDCRNIEQGDRTACVNQNFDVIQDSCIYLHIYENRLRWSRGSVLAFSTQVCGFKPGRKNPQHAFLRRGSKAVGPMS